MRVTVAPITHTGPADTAMAVELPRATKQRFGLDEARSWVVVDELNRFLWPDPDLRPVSRATPDRFAYGAIPPVLFARIVRVAAQAARAKMQRVVPRTQGRPYTESVSH